jgi:hypothetical protein
VVDFYLIIEDRVRNVGLICKGALLVPSRVHYCHDSCFTSRCFLFADFAQLSVFSPIMAEIMLGKSSLLGDMGDYDYSSLSL